MSENHGNSIRMEDGNLHVPDDPIIPFIEGDGTGRDIWRASVRVFDAAVEKAYGGKRKIAWQEVLAGEKAFKQTGNWLPDETLDGVPQVPRRHQGAAHDADRRRHPLAQRGAAPDARPLRLPAPGALVQRRAEPGASEPGDVDMVIFRENTEDIYAGIECREGTPEAKKVLDFLANEMGVTKIRFPKTSGIGIKPVSREGTERLVRAAIALRPRARAARASRSCTRATS